MKRSVVLGAGGFIGGHLVTRLKKMGYWVRGVDIKYHEYKKSDADEFIIADLRNRHDVERVLDQNFDEVYQLAADMGGADYIFRGINDADIMHNSAIINLNVLEACVAAKIGKVFYSSSACVYPEHNQMDPDNPLCSEDSVYPANPDSEYGWEKLFSERLFLCYMKNKGLSVRIGRFHNVFGPYGAWNNGKEKAPAAICRKVLTSMGGEMEIYGDGKQTRSFLYVDECVEGIIRLMDSDVSEPLNIGSDQMITINQLADIICSFDNKTIEKKHIPGPQGVRGRNSDNRLIYSKLGWKPSGNLEVGLKVTYEWIKSQICDARQSHV